MGSIQSKRRKKKEVVRGLREKVRMLEKEMREMIWIRESENETHQREIMVYSLKERKWRRERKRMREEVKRLRKMLEERERREKYYHDEEEERARRDDAVERWKRLYLAIKVELDALILRTHQGERLHDRSEEELKEKLQRDMRAKEETIELLQAKIASMEQKESKREREVDLLKQSFRILSYNKKLKSLPKGFFQTPAYAKKQLVAI
ncbi:hypothetical protein NMG60_11017577 [Bertholletia excelsa]